MKSEHKKTFADDLTLDEIQANDLEMTKEAIKHAQKYSFGPDAKKAVLFVRTCVDATLKRLGLTSPQPPPNCNSPAARARHAAKIDAEMAEKQVRIENRNSYRGSDIWRCGLYIYQRDELVAFISDVLTERKTEVDAVYLTVGRESVGYMVITNAVLDETKRIFDMGRSNLVLPAAMAN